MSRARAFIPLDVEPAIPPGHPLLVSPPPRRAPGLGLFVFGLVVALAATGGYAWRSRQIQAAKPALVPLRTATVSGGDVHATIRLTGVTAAENAVSIIAPQLYGSRHIGRGHADFGLLIQDLAPAGTFVNKGDQVASFDRQYMLLRLDDHKAIMTGHLAYMRVLKAQLEVRRKAHEQRIRSAQAAMDKAALNLKTAPVRSAIQTERFRLQYEEAKARHKEYVDEMKYFDESERSGIRRLDLDIKEQSLGLQRAERNLERMVVRAPISGILVLQNIHRGLEMGQIQAGDQLYPGHSFAQIVDQRSMVVNAGVNQVDAERLRLGQRAHVHFDAYPDLELPAHVIATGLFANASGFRRAYVKSIPVRLKLDGIDPRVIPNFTVSADVTLATEEPAAVAPLESIFTDQAGAEPYVFVRTGAGWEKRNVEVGLRNHVAVAVRKGLRPGEVIAAERPPL